MNTYNGRAVLIAEEDVEVRVTVNLRRYRDGLHTAWRGTITPAPDDHKSLLGLTAGRLRLPDGTEAAFLRPDTSELAIRNWLEIIGQDEPPF